MTKRGSRSSATFKSDLDSISAAMAHVAGFAEIAGLGQEDAFKLQLVVEELMANTIKHGGVEGDAPIGIDLEGAEEAVVVIYTDTGQAFDPVAHPDVPPREDYIGGYGLQLIRGFCRGLDYKRLGEQNRISLELPISGHRDAA